MEAGFTVVVPSLFGTPEAPMSALNTAKTSGRVCVNRELTRLATGVGALGMWFTGGSAPAMMVDTSVVAPVLAQPWRPS